MKDGEDTKSPIADVQAPGNTDAQKGLDPQAEMKKLERTWAITDVVENGTRATADQKENGLGRVVIKGDKITVRPLRSGPGTTFTFHVDPTKSPKLIGLIPLNDKKEDDGYQPIRLGIYELKGDTLTICAGMDRPDSLEVAPGSKRDLLVLKWAKW